MQINFKRSLINWIHRKKSVLVSVETLESQIVRTVLNVAGQGFKLNSQGEPFYLIKVSVT